MHLTNDQRAALRLEIARKQSARRAEVLRTTTRPAQMTASLARETMGADPWTTRSAPGRSFDDAWNTNALVTRTR